VSAAFLLASALARAAAAAELGGHDAPPPSVEAPAAPTADERRATLEELWQRRILPPDQDSWSPQDMALLLRIRRVEDDALSYLREKFGGYRPWVAKSRPGAALNFRLTKEGYEKYEAVLTQDAFAYFESKGADAKDVFKLKDWDGRALFDEQGRATEDGARLYLRARRKLEAFWRGPDGRVYGTRRPPAPLPSGPAAAPAPPAAAPAKASGKNP